VARAKTTQRAEARRRYRAQIAAETAAAETAATSGDVEANTLASGQPTPNVLSAGRRASAPASGSNPPAPPARLGLVQAFRVAAHPADIPGDLWAFPRIARSTKAVWLPTLLIVGTGVVFLVPALAENQIVRFAGVALLAPPPMIPAFLAGMLTQRGSWLTGGFAGLVSGLVVALLITISPSTTSSTQGLDVQNIGYLILVGPTFGVAVGAFAGFYRRFLAMSAPARTRSQRKSGQGSKAASARRR
jgi:hypothetical protein